VWDVPLEITVYQKSKSVWVAVGDYMERIRIEVKASSASAATIHWQEAARYRGNVGSSPPSTSWFHKGSIAQHLRMSDPNRADQRSSSGVSLSIS
jgi:hypothetical protein